MPDLHTGTVTFLFTDIEGSTRLWEQYPEAMRVALARHDALLRETILAHGGCVFKTVGDQFCAAFATAPDAVGAALAAQRALRAEPWGAVGQAVSLPAGDARQADSLPHLQVRMALHTGAAEQRESDYFGPPLNRVARLLDAGHGGQILISQATADLVRDTLAEAASLRDLGAHRLKDLHQPEHLFQLVHPDLPGDFPPLRSLEAFAHNLPRQLTSFIGREREMDEVKELLARTALLTLTGSGGCGKTRLALQVAADLVEEFADGIWLVELAALADPMLVPQTVASALGLREEPGRSLEATLADYLRGRSLLLVLDNCEHLLDACAQLVDRLLRACPKLRVMASSREGLGIAGEVSYQVPSLSLPDPRQFLPAERLQEFEAVRLFTDRARMSQPSFALNAQNAPAVAQICYRLDGIPLAIELAAARVKALPVEKLNERLDDRFRLLTGGSRTALPRQQTLRATLDWSYDLLTEAERSLLRRLSVFAGGWTLEAAEAVCAGEQIEEWEVLDLLTSLVEKSLVVYEEQDGGAHYRLLETVRQYARDRLQEAGEAAAVRDRHLAFFLSLAEQAEPELAGPALVPWLDRLQSEQDNLRAALGWSQSQPDGAESWLRLAGALWFFWRLRDHVREGHEWLRGALRSAGKAAPKAARAKALLGLGGVLLDLDDQQRENADFEESLALFRELGDQRGMSYTLSVQSVARNNAGSLPEARALAEKALEAAQQARDRFLTALALWCLGFITRNQGDLQQAAARFEESAALSRELEHPWLLGQVVQSWGLLALRQGDHDRAAGLFAQGEALFRQMGSLADVVTALLNRGVQMAQQGDYAEARALHERSLAMGRGLGARGHTFNALLNMGHVCRQQGDYEKARSLYEESLAIARKSEKPTIAWALVDLGLAIVKQGAHEAARTLARESLVIWRDLGEGRGVTRCLECLAQVAHAQGEPERVARLYGAAEALREAIGWPLAAGDRADYAVVPAAHAALGDEAFAAAWEEGRVMTLEQAVAYALEERADA